MNYSDPTAPDFRYDAQGWTIAVRKPTANRFRRVSDLDLTWDDAATVAAAVGAAHPDLIVYYVSNARAESDGRVCGEDIGNVLSHTGKRVPLVDALTIGDLIDATPVMAAIVDAAYLSAVADDRADAIETAETAETAEAAEAAPSTSWRKRMPVTIDVPNRAVSGLIGHVVGIEHADDPTATILSVWIHGHGRYRVPASVATLATSDDVYTCEAWKIGIGDVLRHQTDSYVIVDDVQTDDETDIVTLTLASWSMTHGRWAREHATAERWFADAPVDVVTLVASQQFERANAVGTRA